MKVQKFELDRGEYGVTGVEYKNPPTPPRLDSEEALHWDWGWGAPVYAEAACRLRVEVYRSEEHRHVWALYQSDGKRLDVTPTRQGVVPFDEGAGAFVDMDAAGPVMVETSDGAFLMEVEGKTLSFYS